MSPTHYQPRIALEEIAPSPTNPRKHFDQAALDDLTENVRKHDVMMPVLVRPNPAKGKGALPYELVAGERRYRAAKAAGLADIPAVVRELSDVEVLEMQVSENSQRTDLHPLEEAEGYGLILAKGYDVARLAERVGRSVQYVHDRVKLLMLTKPAQKLFLKGAFTLGHAILLARLTKDEQAKALDPDTYPVALFERAEASLFHEEAERDNVDTDAEDETHGGPVKPVSVREFQAWIDSHVRFDDKAVEPLLFPEAAAQLERARETAEKIVHITYERELPKDGRGDQRTYLRDAWERADGKRGSKTCDHSVTGVVVIGPDRGLAFKVCVANTKCRIHWKEKIQEKEERKAAIVDAVAKGKDPQQAVSDKAQQARAREAAASEAYQAVRPALEAAFAAAVRKAPAGANGYLGGTLLELLYVHPESTKLVPLGKTAEDLVRSVVFSEVVLNDLDRARSIDDHQLKAMAKELGVDLKKVIAAAAPKADQSPKKPAKKAKVKPGRRAA